MKPARIVAALVVGALLCAATSPARAQEAPSGEEAKTREKGPIERATDVVGNIGQCRQPGDNPINAGCGIRLFHKAGNILRDAGVEPEAAPRLWWTIYEGLGTGFAQLGKFDKALSFYKLAGAIADAPPRAREESAYYVGRTQHELGRIDEAIHTFDTLFSLNKGWLEQAERDPRLADLRRTEQWRNMMRYYVKAAERESGTPPADSSDSK